jgi:Na+-driven multidrug efflux pump
MNKHDLKIFFRFVFPSVLSFALSGVYAIVDGFFVGNSIGDVGLSAVNIAYPIIGDIGHNDSIARTRGVRKALGTGIGMGGAIYYSINTAEKQEKRAREFTAGALWVLILSSILFTFLIFVFNRPLLSLLGAGGEILSLGEEYIAIIALGAALQIIGTGLIPFIRNHGGSFYAMLIALVYLLRKKQFTLHIAFSKLGKTAADIIKVGIAPFGLAMSPNISLIIINRFSMSYGGEKAIATYACIAYIICIIYLIFQGVGDGCQPLLSQCYGEKDYPRMKSFRKMAYAFALILSVAGCIVMFLMRNSLGTMFGASSEVNIEIAEIIPIFLVSVPFVAIIRVATASFYATEKSMYSYILTFIEPVFMLILMLILPPLFGGQIMIWWSTVNARILSALLALLLKQRVDKEDLYKGGKLVK